MDYKGNNSTILLINPPISKYERYSSDIGALGGAQIPLGIFYLASYLREHNFQVHCIDGEARHLSNDQIVSEIAQIKPSYIGITATTVAFSRALSLADAIKKWNISTPIIIGGPHISSNIHDVMIHDCFDYGIFGEGEITFFQLVSILKKRGEPTTVDGLAYRKNGELMVNPPREYIKNLDDLPFPAYDLIPDISLYHPDPSNYKFKPVINIITSRGCPNNCTFCDRNVFGRQLRQRSPENVVKEIEYLVTTFDVKEIAFVDDTFTIGKDRLKSIFSLLENKNIYIPWTCMSRINTVDYDILQMMKKSGCWRIKFGIESGDEEILKTIKKNINLKDAKRIITYCRKLKIRTTGFFIIGHPGETKDTIQKTIRCALNIPFDDIVVTINTPIPGTVQYSEVNTYGVLDTSNWNKFNYWSPVFIPYGLDKAYLLKKQRDLYRKFYFRPHIIFRLLLDLISPTGITRLLSYFLGIRYLITQINSSLTKIEK
ncbi:MAG: radical SAM protein [Methanospirillaceae archaeon]|nr:radical SAM protein [Methanospirillaceae archaeon]